MKRIFSIVVVSVACIALAIAGNPRVMAPQQKTNIKKDNEMKTLTVYFSYTAGNTKRIAEKVRETVGGDLVSLEPVKPYSDNYDEVVKQGQQEVEHGYKPELKPLGVDLKEYDRIIVGTPTWWYRMAPAVLTFLSDNDFKGKVVVPFMTNAGWPGSVIKDMTTLAEKNGARVENAHEFKFSSDEKHFDRMDTSEQELNRWLDSLK